MSPEFDPRKEAANLTKHGVSLTEGEVCSSIHSESRSRILPPKARCAESPSA
jgi:uncharacterized DUF497 family protein